MAVWGPRLAGVGILEGKNLDTWRGQGMRIVGRMRRGAVPKLRQVG